MTRTAFLVDGFNLYHSLRAASADLSGAHTRWLDLRAFCDSYLAEVGGRAVTVSTEYFTARPAHRELVSPGTLARHRDYLDCLRNSGVTVVAGHFKEKRPRCGECGSELRRFEEKETDVAIGVRLLDLLWTDACDAVVLVTGDSDLAPAVRCARARFPDRQVLGLFPYRRLSFELKALANRSFGVKAARYSRFQFPSTVRLATGRSISRPARW